MTRILILEVVVVGQLENCKIVEVVDKAVEVVDKAVEVVDKAVEEPDTTAADTDTEISWMMNMRIQERCSMCDLC